jgi:hypothetical protein
MFAISKSEKFPIAYCLFRVNAAFAYRQTPLERHTLSVGIKTSVAVNWNYFLSLGISNTAPTDEFTPQKGDIFGNISLACNEILFFVGTRDGTYLYLCVINFLALWPDWRLYSNWRASAYCMLVTQRKCAGNICITKEFTSPVKQQKAGGSVTGLQVAYSDNVSIFK